MTNLTADEARALLTLLRKAEDDTTLPAWVGEHLNPVINWAGGRVDTLRYGVGGGLSSADGVADG